MQRDTHRHGEREAERDTERDTRRHTERHFCVTGQCTNACRHDHATRRPRPQCGGGERACRGQHPNYATGTCTHHDPGRHERTSSAKLGRHIETRRDTDRHRHTHTLVVDARYVAVLPISRDDHTGPDEADYATQPSSLPGGGPAAGNSAWGPLRSAREPGISHAATSRDPAPSWVPVVIVQPRRSPVNAGFFTDRHTVHTHTLTVVVVVVVQYIAVLPISRNDLGGPAGADHYLWEPPRDSPVPPQGATNRKWTLQCNSLLHALIRLPNVESNRDRTASYYPDRNWRLPESALDPRGLTSRVSRLPGMDIEGFTETRKGEPP